MSEIKDKVKRDIEDVILGFAKGNFASVVDAAEAILSCSGLAIVDRKVEPPHLPTTDLAHFAARAYRDLMLKAGWVKEVKNGDA